MDIEMEIEIDIHTETEKEYGRKICEEEVRAQYVRGTSPRSLLRQCPNCGMDLRKSTQVQYWSIYCQKENGKQKGEKKKEKKK